MEKKEQIKNKLKEMMKGFEIDEMMKDKNDEWLIKNRNFDENDNEIWVYENCWVYLNEDYYGWSDRDVRLELIESWVEIFQLKKLIKKSGIC